MNLRSSMSAGAVLCLLAAAPYSNAAVVQRYMQNQSNSTSICHGARPIDETQMWGGALEMRNDGTQNSFVTCAFQTTRDMFDDTWGSDLTTFYTAFFTNHTAVNQSVRCTGVEGYYGMQDIVYITQTSTAYAPGTTPPDTDPFPNGVLFGDTSLRYQIASMTCLVPVGVGIADVYAGYLFNDDQGAS